MPLKTTAYDVFETYTDENTGMPFNTVVATEIATGKGNLSTECNFGASPGDKKALVRLVEPVTPP
jgi:glutaminase